MTYLPNSVMAYDDEVWTGYLIRASLVNGCSSLAEFYDRFLYRGVKKPHYGSWFLPYGLPWLCDRMSENPLFPDLEQAVKMTALYDRGRTCDMYRAARTAEYIMYDRFNPATPIPGGVVSPHFRLCPDCMREDITRHGHYYFHMRHHLEGVKVCHVHRRALFELPKYDMRRHVIPYIADGVQIEVEDMDAEVRFAKDAEKAFEQASRTMLLRRICPDCGRKYLIHPYSEETGAGCPYCMARMTADEIIAKRLQTVRNGEYELAGPVSTIAGTQVRHIPCGSVKKNLHNVLWGKHADCPECRTMSLKKIRARIGDAEKEYNLLGMSTNANGNRMVDVYHTGCGQKYSMALWCFANRPHCPYCDGRHKIVTMDHADPEYELLSEYVNNREPVRLRHKPCGVEFITSKVSFLAGARCPICCNKLPFAAVRDAVSDCAPGYSVEKHANRGCAVLYKDGEIISDKISCRQLVNDLKSDDPAIFIGRIKKYVEPLSPRKKVYDAVREKTVSKGFWTARDGIDGRPATEMEHRLIYHLTKLGYITRVGWGKYRTGSNTEKKEKEEENAKNTTNEMARS